MECLQQKQTLCGLESDGRCNTFLLPRLEVCNANDERARSHLGRAHRAVGTPSRRSANSRTKTRFRKMLLRRARLLRTLTALLLTLSFGLYSAESLLADVHDDDATHEELLRIDGADRHAAAHRAHGDDAPTSGTNVARNGAPDSAEQHPGERSSGQSEHGEHACHHAHVHAGWLRTDELRIAPLAWFHGSPVGTRDRAPTSRDAEPQFRPPIT